MQKTTFSKAFSSFSVNDIDAARKFYGNTLGLDASREGEGGLSLKFENENIVYVYPKDDHEPATFTVLNLSVEDIDIAVDDLTSNGIEFESYGGDIKTDEKGIFRGGDSGRGPNIAWFKDPAGNILSVMEAM